MTHRILKMLKLEALLKYITFPSVIQIEEDRDLFYLAVKLYPKKIKYNEKDLILRVYKRVLKGDMKRFPKQFLAGAWIISCQIMFSLYDHTISYVYKY